MARPQKIRTIGAMPTSEGFTPLGCSMKDCNDRIIMTIVEYETIRLIDAMGLTQEQCATSMNISRPTVTNIYEVARHKLADALINEKLLLIEGGHYDLCPKNKKLGKLEKEKEKMKIAITYTDGQVFQHFGHCEQFKIYEVENHEILSARIEDATGSGHGALAGFLKGLGVEAVICGGIGGGAQTALKDAGIQLYGGVSGNADTAVQALIAGTLEYNADIHCDHHNEGHKCGSHSCKHE